MVGAYRDLLRAGGTLAMWVLVLTMTFCCSASAAESEYVFLENFGPDGTELSGFQRAGPVAFDQQSKALYVVSGTESDGGILYKFDSDGVPDNWGGTAPYVSGNEISGLVFAGIGPEERQVAVDSANHSVYVVSANSVRAFQANGEPADFSAGPWAGTSSIGGFSRLAGIAVDVNGYIYASDYTAGLVKIFAPSGEQVNEFLAADAANLAVDTSGAVYVNRRQGTVRKFVPSEFPVTGGTTYEAEPKPLSPNGSYTVAVDPATDNVYISSSPKIEVYDEGGALLAAFPQEDPSNEIDRAQGIAIDGDSTKIYVGNYAGELSLSQVKVFKEIPPPPGPPTIDNLSAGRVTSSSATLHALVDPNSLATDYRFEYGLADCSVSICAEVPVGGGSLEAKRNGIWVSQEIEGLQPSTTYHYRVVAESELGSDETKRTFTTQAADSAFELSDERVWEMVSPVTKRGALLRGSGERTGPVQAAPDGNGIAFSSVASVEVDPDGSRSFEAASILAKREGTEWRSEDITPPNRKVVSLLIGQQGEYKLFSPDLSEAILDPREGTSLSPEATERAPYLRENSQPPTYKPMVTGKEGFANVPPGFEFGGTGFVSAVTIQSATRDLSHVVLRSQVPLVAGAPAEGLYEWVRATGQLRPINVRPANEAGGAMVASRFVGSGWTSLRHAISEDGSRIFWSAESLPNRLFMREMEAGKTVRINIVQPGGGGGTSSPVFQGASADGSVVYFTDAQRLTGDASAAGRDLYRCEISDPLVGCASITNITAPLGSENSEVQGIVSALSEDGSRIYFVAKGVLDTEANELGRAAVAGEPNLYFWEEGAGVRFIATLATEDKPDWGIAGDDPRAASLSAASSPGGRYFAFMSQRSLTDPDDPEALNVDPVSGKPVELVYRYDAAGDRLECISCAPTGAAPWGEQIRRDNQLVDPRGQWDGRYAAATLPQPVTIEGGAGLTIYRPRAVLDNGRVFFNSLTPLAPADANEQWDVYQYEDLNTGDCTTASGNEGVVRLPEGCVSLISSGTSDSETGFLDASESGDDVFFLTTAKLSVADIDEEPDVYDARVGGTAAVLDPVEECLGDSCRPAPPAPPAPDGAPGSSTCTGPGNVKEEGRKKCPKGKRLVVRKGKEVCVPRKGKKTKVKKSQRRAGQRQGAGN